MNLEKDETILSDFSLLVDSDRRLMSRNSILMMISVIVIISITNVLIITLSIPSSLSTINPRFADRRRVVLAVSVPILVVIPFASFVLSLLASMVPVKRYDYSQKIIPFALWILLVLQVIVSGFLIIDWLKR